jgi:hypothetical protein
MGRRTPVRTTATPQSGCPLKRSFECRYAAMQVEIKKKYALWLTPAEREKVAKVLASC